MRGRTLNDAFILLDEAQNTTRAQMKMFLTRLGFSSKMVVTGDITQIDLPKHQASGLEHALAVLGRVDDIAICRLGKKDVVRHHLVECIVHAYESDSDLRI
jgi:phosphate starvation-inducible PhoH-like protein